MTWVGLDVHARSTHAAAIDLMTGELKRARFGPGNEAVVDWLAQLPQPRAVYEAGPTGFALFRAATARGIAIDVVAPSKTARPAGERVKTDRKDAELLARLGLAGQLHVVAVADAFVESARHLSRTREQLRQDLMRARHRVSKLLLQHGRVYPEPTTWNRNHRSWLARQRFDDEPTEIAFVDLLAAADGLGARKEPLEAHLFALAIDARLRPTVERLRAFRGIDTLTAFAQGFLFHGPSRAAGLDTRFPLGGAPGRGFVCASAGASLPQCRASWMGPLAKQVAVAVAPGEAGRVLRDDLRVSRVLGRRDIEEVVAHRRARARSVAVLRRDGGDAVRDEPVLVQSQGRGSAAARDVGFAPAALGTAATGRTRIEDADRASSRQLRAQRLRPRAEGRVIGHGRNEYDGLPLRFDLEHANELWAQAARRTAEIAKRRASRSAAIALCLSPPHYPEDCEFAPGRRHGADAG
jgi:hypothetical protein